MSEPLSRSLCARLSMEATVTRSAQEFLDAPRDAQTVSFLDDSTLASLDEVTTLPGEDHVQRPELRKLLAAVSLGPVIAISSQPFEASIRALQHPWLSNVISASMLEQPMAGEHLKNVIETLTAEQPKLLDWLGSTVVGRRVRLSHASKCAERIDRMSEFFKGNGVAAPSVELLRDAAGELLVNAFYDAPVAAGAHTKPIARTQDVAFPADSTCDLAYGSRDDLAIVRVQDPFGALTRARLVDVLVRCSRTDGPVEPDTSMGGAGLGLWRVFSAASLVAVSVVNNHHTEVLVGIGNPGHVGPRPYAFHLFFKHRAKRKFWKFADEDTGSPLNTVSVTVMPDSF